MKRLRLWCVLFFGWLALLYNMERLLEPVNLASFVYVLATALGLAILVIRPMRELPLSWLVTLPLPAILFLKTWLNYPVLGRHLPLTLTEFAAVGITVVLARQLSAIVEEFRAAVLANMTSRLHDRSRSFESGQAEIYREVRRARQYHRPLALLAVSVKNDSVTVSLDRFLREAEREVVREYLIARIAEFLSLEMKDCDIISRRSDHFVTLLPEADSAKAGQIARQLEQAARDKLGLELQIGFSLFPDEEFTLCKLLERAEARLHDAPPQVADAHSNGHTHPSPAPAGLNHLPAEGQG